MSSAAPSAPCRCCPTQKVQEFIGPFKAVNPLLDVEHPVTVGPFDGLHGWYFEHKVSQNRAMERALKVIQDVADEYGELSGRHYGLMDPYRIDDAEIAIVVIGSTAGTTRLIVDKLRAKGVKAGMIRVRVFRPFPYAAFAKALEHVKVVGVMDRADSFGAQGGPLLLGAPRRPVRQRPQTAGACRSSTGSAVATSSRMTSNTRSACSKKQPRARRRSPPSAAT